MQNEKEKEKEKVMAPTLSLLSELFCQSAETDTADIWDQMIRQSNSRTKAGVGRIMMEMTCFTAVKFDCLRCNVLTPEAKGMMWKDHADWRLYDQWASFSGTYWTDYASPVRVRKDKEKEKDKTTVTSMRWQEYECYEHMFNNLRASPEDPWFVSDAAERSRGCEHWFARNQCTDSVNRIVGNLAHLCDKLTPPPNLLLLPTLDEALGTTEDPCTLVELKAKSPFKNHRSYNPCIRYNAAADEYDLIIRTCDYTMEYVTDKATGRVEGKYHYFNNERIITTINHHVRISASTGETLSDQPIVDIARPYNTTIRGMEDMRFTELLVDDDFAFVGEESLAGLCKARSVTVAAKPELHKSHELRIMLGTCLEMVNPKKDHQIIRMTLACVEFDLTHEFAPRIRDMCALHGFGENHRQKNWMPVVCNNELFFIYSFFPFVLLKCDVPTGRCWPVRVTVPVEPNRWRGSGGPIDVSANKLCRAEGVHYLAIVHESYFPAYSHRFIGFDAHLKVTHASKLFTLLDNIQRVEFCCGITMTSDQQSVIVTLGQHDAYAYMMLVDLNSLVQKLMWPYTFAFSHWHQDVGQSAAAFYSGATKGYVPPEPRAVIKAPAWVANSKLVISPPDAATMAGIPSSFLSKDVMQPAPGKKATVASLSKFLKPAASSASAASSTPSSKKTKAAPTASASTATVAVGAAAAPHCDHSKDAIGPHAKGCPHDKPSEFVQKNKHMNKVTPAAWPPMAAAAVATPAAWPLAHASSSSVVIEEEEEPQSQSQSQSLSAPVAAPSVAESYSAEAEEYDDDAFAQ